MQKNILLCPVCNGIEELETECIICKGRVQDRGPIENFLGPYSAYEEQKVFERQETEIIGEGYCWHRVVCIDCANEQKVAVECRSF